MVEMLVVERVMCVVDRCLRNQFPDDYYKRCMYASFGIYRLLQAMGHSPVVVGGNFLAFVVARNEPKGSMQGYVSDASKHAHFWIEVDHRLLDLGTYYLPSGSSFPACDIPATYWDKSHALPSGLRYEPEARYGSLEAIYLEPHIAEKMERFLSACTARIAKPLVKPTVGKWLVISPASIDRAANKGDMWAQGMVRHQRRSTEESAV